MSKQIPDLQVATQLQKEDEFLFYQNSTQTTKRISRGNMFASPGVLGGDVPSNIDTTPPATPTGLTVTTATEKDRDGTEKVYIKASITANTETDLASYGWSIRRISGTPTFSGGNLTGYSEAQIFGPTVNVSLKDDANAIKMSWEVRSYTWYEVKVCAIDKSNNASAYTALTSSTVIQSARDTTAPAAPTSVAATSAIKSVFLTWTNPTDADLAYINIYRNTSNTPPTIGTTTPYAKISSNSYVDSNTTQGTTYYYWLTSVDFSGNETATTSTVVSIQPGLVANTDITTFAIDATKMFTNTVILKADTWADNSNNGTPNSASGYIYWNAHTLVYGGASYSISAGSTNLQFVYWTGGTTYQTSDTNPTLTDGQFMIATNAKNSSGVATGLHDLAWNAMANAVIGSAYIQNAAITNAKVNDLAVDKLTSGSISAQTITLIGDSTIKSSTATSGSSGTGFWIKSSATATEFSLGDFAGTNYGYLKWANNTLTIKGAINATSLTLTGTTLAASSVSGLATVATSGAAANISGLATVATSGAASDVGLGNVQNLNAANQTTTGLESSITINSGGITMGTGGFVQGGIAWNTTQFTTSGSGFFLGRSSSQYRFFLGETGTTGLGGNNYLYWNGSSLTIRGAITATSLTLSGATVPASGVTGLATVATSGAAANVSGLATVATSGAAADVGLGSVSNLNPANQTINGIQSTITINSGGIAMGTGGFVRGNIDWLTSNFTTNSSGFYLGYAGSQYRFYIGQTGASGTGGTGSNYLYWNGTNLSYSGVLRAVTSDGGDTEAGLVITSGFGIRYGDDASVLTINGGNGNGTEFGAQLDLIGSNFAGVGGAAQGQLALSAGYLGSFSDTYDGSIVFRTSLGSYGSGTSNYIGIRRIIIERDGTVTIGSKSDSVIGPNSGSGVLIVETSIKSPYIYFGTGGYTSMSITNNFGNNNSLVFAGGTGDSDSSAFRWVNSGNSSELASLSTAGVLAATSFVSSSSKRFKKKIKKFKGGLDILEQLNPVTFDWKKKDIKDDIGLIAEDVNEILPVLVGKNGDGQCVGIDYSKLTVVLINAIKELKKEVEKLKNANSN